MRIGRRTKKHTLRELFALMPVINQEKFTASLENVRRPKKLCGKDTPENLNGLSYGKFCALSYASRKPEETIFEICRILLDIDKAKLMQAPADDVFGFIRFVGDEVKRINKLFTDISIEPTQEQIQAGANNLNFGAFGTLDWYARRMGITNHDEVMALPWERIYQCMKIDNDTQMYERRLNKVFEQKAKQRK